MPDSSASRCRLLAMAPSSHPLTASPNPCSTPGLLEFVLLRGLRRLEPRRRIVLLALLLALLGLVLLRDFGFPCGSLLRELLGLAPGCVRLLRGSRVRCRLLARRNHVFIGLALCRLRRGCGRLRSRSGQWCGGGGGAPRRGAG